MHEAENKAKQRLPVLCQQPHKVFVCDVMAFDSHFVIVNRRQTTGCRKDYSTNTPPLG
jgi:hypothetical protein